MAWDDESWKDSYDAWKLASPDDGWEEVCEHEDYDADILTGTATCYRCGYRWSQTEAEIAAEIERIRAYDELEREQRTLRYRLKEWLTELLWQLRYHWATRHQKKIVDDDIPF